jgi:hypothetical protein
MAAARPISCRHRGELGLRTRAVVESGQVRVVAPFHIRAIDRSGEALHVIGETRAGLDEVAVDELVVATGFRPDFSFLREIRLALDPALESAAALGPLIDPNVHSCGTVPPHGVEQLRHPEPDFYIVGMKSYGRAPTFLLATGYEQVRSVVAALASDIEAARRVELVLPETGVCSEPKPHGIAATAACCDTPAARPRVQVTARTCC